jgi:exodeoxyribonuclease VII large subunit
LTREPALRAAKDRIKCERSTLETLQAKLIALGPNAVLERGYAILTDSAGKTVIGVNMLKPKDRIEITMRDGTAEASVERVDLQG